MESLNRERPFRRNRPSAKITAFQRLFPIARRYTMIARFTVAAVALLGFALPEAQAQNVKIVKEFKGEAPAAKLEKAVGGTSYVSNAAAFKKLWDATGTKEAMPKVDFAKQLVVRAYAREASEITLQLKLSDKGDLSVGETKKDGPSAEKMAYHIAIINRDGIKTVGGRKIRD
jgi:hypothetical protein